MFTHPTGGLAYPPILILSSASNGIICLRHPNRSAAMTHHPYFGSDSVSDNRLLRNLPRNYGSVSQGFCADSVSRRRSRGYRVKGLEDSIYFWLGQVLAVPSSSAVDLKVVAVQVKNLQIDAS